MSDIVSLQTHLQSSLATRTAAGVLTRVFKELDSLAEGSPNDGWAEKLVDLYTFSNEIEIGFLHAKAYILAILKPRWEQLSHEFRQQHGGDFMTFAKLYTGGKQVSTINNYVDTATVWFVNKAAPGKLVDIVLRTPDGKPVIKNGKPEIIRTEFDPFAVEMSKLLIVKARATRGEMTDRLWEMLVDPFYTCEDLRLEHVGSTETQDMYDIVFYLEGPGLFAHVNGTDVCLAEYLNWEEYETNPAVTQALDLLLRRASVRHDEDIIYILNHRANGKAVVTHEEMG